MANNPVQVVLNAQSYVDFVNNPPGGSIKDFFAGKDAEFQVHKDKLIAQVGDLQKALANAPKGELI